MPGYAHAILSRALSDKFSVQTLFSFIIFRIHFIDEYNLAIGKRSANKVKCISCQNAECLRYKLKTSFQSAIAIHDIDLIADNIVN